MTALKLQLELLQLENEILRKEFNQRQSGDAIPTLKGDAIPTQNGVAIPVQSNVSTPVQNNVSTPVQNIVGGDARLEEESVNNNSILAMARER
ncbi:uncharacterized protein [Drosophila kikkawai]|uniref:Uncharacterized protein isoform X3 n=1 Tax=Drosophila kikkawai TaxID=30033 RepID=A0ABM4GJX7_DROKI